MINTLDYHSLLEEVNRETIYLINEDVADEIEQNLERLGFERFENDSARLKFSGKKVQVIYNIGAEKPFTVVLEEKDAEAVLEAEKTLESILKSALEDI